jgi:hypothetical protein
MGIGLQSITDQDFWVKLFDAHLHPLQYSAIGTIAVSPERLQPQITIFSKKKLRNSVLVILTLIGK